MVIMILNIILDSPSKERQVVGYLPKRQRLEY